MGLPIGDELRLLFAVLLNVAALWGAWRLARRFNTELWDAAGDACLIYFLIQYVSVCAPGAIGALNPITIGAVALFLSASAAAAGRSSNESSTNALARAESGAESWIIAGAIAFVVTYIGALVWHQRPLPTISNDAITYHLPAAVQWLQTGRLGLYETWFYNPANSYSPLGGSAFIAWWIAPLGNDVIARFVQVGPMLMLLLAMMNLLRRMGVNVATAAVIAASAVMTRSFVSQTILAKDDPFVAAFFVMAVDALLPRRLEEKVGPWRAGIAIGLLFAMKYTVLFSAPLLLLMLNRAWTWRRLAVIAMCTLILAGPWYLRNIILTGNPLYPTTVRIGGLTLFDGMLDVKRSALLSNPASAWRVFTGGYYGVTQAIALVLLAGWIGAIVAGGKALLRDPLWRTCVVGPVIGILFFVLAAPYGEMRFAYPSILLLFGALAITLMRLPLAMQLGAGAILIGLAATTAFDIRIAWWLTTAAVIGAAIAMLTTAVWTQSRVRKLAAYAAIVVAFGIALYGYVNYKSYVASAEQDSVVAWADRGVYGPIGEIWGFVRNEVPKGVTIAYANTFFTYPLMGYRYDHRVVYVPTRSDVNRFADLPRIEKRITGEEIVATVVDALREKPDREKWIERLQASGAKYLVVAKRDPGEREQTKPAEITFAEMDPKTFREMFENESGVVYEINW